MKLDVAQIAKDMGPGVEKESPDEDQKVTEEGLGIAADEIMDAFDKRDRTALMAALRNFVAMARD